jgi:hypothetical protein
MPRATDIAIAGPPEYAEELPVGGMLHGYPEGVKADSEGLAAKRPTLVLTQQTIRTPKGFQKRNWTAHGTVTPWP